MSIAIEPPDKETVKVLRALILGTYLDGECYAFAIALHRELEWPMVGLISNNELRHVGVKAPDRMLFDARGPVPVSEFGKPFSISPPYTLQEVSESDLFAVRPIEEHSIQGAITLAEVVWADLPWKQGRLAKILAFARDLEAISRKHKVWIRAPYPTAKPVVGLGYGDEAGYVIQPINANSFTLDRVL